MLFFVRPRRFNGLPKRYCTLSLVKVLRDGNGKYRGQDASIVTLSLQSDANALKVVAVMAMLDNLQNFP